MRDFHLDITGSFCDDIRDGDNEPYKNKHFVFLNKAIKTSKDVVFISLSYFFKIDKRNIFYKKYGKLKKYML